jgi:hypothetical protein
MALTFDNLNAAMQYTCSCGHTYHLLKYEYCPECVLSRGHALYRELRDRARPYRERPWKVGDSPQQRS